jgi:WD40 repeat protein
MWYPVRRRGLNLPLLAFLLFPSCFALTLSASREAKPGDEGALGARANSTRPTPDQAQPAPSKPEIVLQAGITSPQTQIGFSPDGRLLASMGMNGNAIKLWEVASGRLLRQLDSGIPSMGASSLTRPFRFSAGGRTLIAMADGRIRRWEVETGRELSSTALPTAKDFMAAILSEDGSVFAATSLNNSAIRLWETTGGRELRTISFDNEEHIATQDAIALSPKGNLFAALTETVKGSRKGIETSAQVALWDVASGRKAVSLKVTSAAQAMPGVGKQASLAFSSDGAWVAMRDETSIKIWEVATGREVKSFGSPKIGADASDPAFIMFASKFVFSSDRRLLSAVSEGRNITLLDTASATTLYTLAGHKGAIVGVSFSADGHLIASSGVDNQIKVWETASGREVKTLSGSAMPISDIAFSADGRQLFLAGQQAVNTWELTTGGVRRSVALPDEYARERQNGLPEASHILSPDGRFLIAGSISEPVAKIWEVASGRELPSLSLAQGKELGKAAFNTSGSVVALVERDNQKPGGPIPQAPAQAPAGMPSQPPGAIVMPDMSKIMEQMRKDPKKMQEQLKKAEEAMKKGDLSAGLSVMETLGISSPLGKPNKSPNSLRLLDVATGRQMQAIALPSGFMNDAMSNSAMSSSALSFSPDGRTLASALGFGAPITLRDAATGQELRTLKSMLSMSVYGLAWSADGGRLASAHWGLKRNITDPNVANTFSFEDMTFAIKVWDGQTGTELSSLAGHNNFVNGLAFSRDGRWLASGSYDSTIKVWDLATGSELRALKGHTGSILALDFSLDGRFVVSGSDDGSTRLWNAQTGELLATLVILNKGDDWLVVTPNGLFDGSPGGWNQILWRFSQAIYDVSPVEIFFNEYFHPGLLPDILAGKNLGVIADISQKDRRQPKLSLELAGGPNAGASVSTRALNVSIKITEAAAGAQDVRLFRNGSLVKVWRGDVLRGQTGATLETTVSLVAGQNHLSAYGFNRDNVKSADATLFVNGAGTLRRAGTLHLLAVGVDQYANPGYNLKYAVADARAFAEEVERQQRKLGGYGQIEVTTLLDGDATKANLLYALKRLAGSGDLKAPGGKAPGGKAPEGAPAALEKIRAVEPEDAVVIFYAGHGTAQEQRFYLIPHDLGYQGARTGLDQAGLKTILSHSVSDLELEQACEGIDAGHMLMVIDACNSGQALEAEEKRRGPMNSKGLAQLAYEKGMYILTAAQSYQAALEAEQLGHGYLTYALVEEGLKSSAADLQPKDSQVVLREWLDYATERVPGMQAAKMREARDLKHKVAFVEGEEKVEEVDKRSLQRPRVFYRREPEAQPLVIWKP